MTQPTANIKEETRKLVALQDIDKKIYALRKEKAGIPAKINDLEAAFESKKAQLKSLEELKQKQFLKQKEKEGDLAAREDAIKKSQVQLGQLKTNKEYQAKLTEIESLKADRSIIEEEILKAMDEIDVLKKNADIEKAKLSVEEKESTQQKDSLAARTKEIEGTLQDLEGKRKILTDQVDKKILQQYEHILHGRDGLALVKVADGSCGGCFMKVPPQVINEIKMHERAIICEVCARILYLEEDLQP